MKPKTIQISEKEDRASTQGNPKRVKSNISFYVKLWYNSNMQKICKSCGESRNVSEYYPHPLYPDGLEASCKDCKKAKRTRRHLSSSRDQDLKFQIRNTDKLMKGKQ